MSTHDTRHETLLDEAVAAVRDDAPDPEVERQAAARVWERLSRDLAVPQPAPEAVERIGSCADYQALIPAYRAGELSAARVLLLEDHARECVPCRRALKGTAEPPARGAAAPRRAAAPQRRIWLALAATLALALGVAGTLALVDLLRGPAMVAEVAAVEGQLFRIGGDAARVLAPGDAIAEGEALRTARGSGAVVTLADGSRLELRQRSEISLAAGRGGTTVQVARGGIIVEAAAQRDGHLYVATEDCRVAVTGTIFAVNHGTKGSRVSVLEGEVRVEQRRRETVLRPGEQLATRPGMGRVPLEAEIAWSRDRERYAALLAEFKTLDQEFQRALARTGLRYQTRLLDLMPAATAIYLALPNLADELSEMHRAFEQRLAESPELEQWWQERVGETGFDAHLDDVVGRIRELGGHLGEEIAVGIALDAEGDPDAPLVLAEVVQPAAFAAVLADEVARLNAAAGGELPLAIVADPSAPAAGETEGLLLWPAGDLFAASTDLERLRELARAVAGSGTSAFAGTPFHARLAEAYRQGAQWLGGVDVGGLVAGSIGDGEDDARALEFIGLGEVEHLIVERKAEGETVHTGAVLSFAGPRRGAAAWLAAPAPMGSLDFISADANFAAAFVVEEPAEILAQTFAFIEATAPEFRGELDRFEAEHEIDLLADLASPLGGEMAFALDGPALPNPAWKVVAEVYDPAALERAIAWGVEEAAAAAGGGDPPLTHGCEETGGRRYCRLAFAEEGLEVHYTFEDGYFVAAPARALLDRALQVRQSRYALPDAPAFVALLPPDGYLNFSAVFYSNLGSLGEALKQAAGGAGLSAEQRQAIEELDLGAPSLTCAYGEADAVRLVSTSRGGLFTSRLGTLLGLSALADLGG